jgi:RHS repeat-associated protein
MNLNAGSVAFSVPIRVPPGVAGQQPNLSLTYSPGIPNGPFGPSWAVSVGAYARKTESGQPLYNAQDTILDASGEELVLMQDGTYRREFELDGQFLRVERFGQGWRQTSKSGAVMLLGQYPNTNDQTRVSRIAQTGSAFDDTFAWLLDEVQDINGNRVQYYYTNFDDSPGNLYLAEVRYSVLGTNQHSVQFDYELRQDREDATLMAGGLADYTSGFLRVWGRRCKAVRVLTCGQPVRSYTFGYSLDPSEDPAPPAPSAIPTQISHLRKITEWDSTGTNHLPPVTFAYQDFLTASGGIVTMSDTPAWSLSRTSHSGVDLFDVNSDGLPDLLNGSLGGQWKYSLNKTGVSFDGAETLMTNSPGYSLSSPSAQVLDINSDGLADFANKSGVNPTDDYRYQLYRGKGVWDAERTFTSNPPFSYNDPDIALLDLDYDKDIDVLYFHSGGESAYFQQNGQWTEVDRPWGDPALADLPTTLRFSSSNTKLADMNGDRMMDIVEFNRNPPYLEVTYWPNLGRGRFAEHRAMAPVVYPYLDVSDIFFLDVNGDGLADLAKLLPPNQIEIRLNMGDGTWSEPFTMESPPYDPTTTAVRVADMNANGSADLLFNNASGQAFEYLDLLGTNDPPNLIKVIDNGLGRRTKVDYVSVADLMSEAESAGHPWSLTIPFAMQVVADYEVTIAQDLDGVPGPDKQVVQLRYRDPYYDADQKQFRGFAFVEKIEHGDEYWGITNGSSPGLVTRLAYHVGAPDGIDNDGNGLVDEMHGARREEAPLRGSILWTELTDVGVIGTELWPYTTNSFLPDALVYSRTYSDIAIRTMYGTNGALLPLLPAAVSNEVRYPVMLASYTEIVEKGAGPKRTLKTAFEYDPYGNGVRREEWGDITPGSTLDDERFTYTTYIYDMNAWRLDRPDHIWLTDEHGQWVKETRLTYDSIGRLKKETRYLDAATPVDVSLIDYDSFGNAVKRTDARGYSITNEFDPGFHTYPITEAVEVGGGSPPLIARAEYDARFGNETSMVDYNNNETRMAYDSFGRLTAIITPGDSTDLPTKSFKYVVCDDLRGWRYEYDALGNLSLTTNHGPGSILTELHSYQRERFGQASVVESVSYIDGLGRVVTAQVQDESGFSVTAASLFDTRGNSRAKFLPCTATGSFLPNTNASRSDFAYDALGRSLKVTLPPDQNGVRHFSLTQYMPLQITAYDFEDTVAGGPHENTPTTTVRDGLGRTIQIIEHNQQGAATGTYTTSFGYNLQDNLLRVTDAHGNTRTNGYDGWGRKTATHDLDKGLFRYFYDYSGNLTRTLDAKGQQNSYTYDGANRRLTEDYGNNGTIDVAYHYDVASPEYPQMQNLKGKLAYVEDGSGSSIFCYDARGNVIQKVHRVARRSGNIEDYPFTSRYDAMDRPFETVFPDGDRLSYQYNERGLLSAVPGVVNSIVYNAAGQRTNVTFANGVITSFNYDPRQRLRRLLTTSPSAEVLQDLIYDLDGANNMLAMHDGRALSLSDPRNQTQDFVLDDLYRLTRATGTGYGTINYAYDKLGNMLSESSPNIADPQINQGARTYGGAAGTQNRGGRLPGAPPGPHALTATANGYSTTYDDNGNMLTARENTYAWDSLDRMNSVTSTNGTTHFIYDYSGRRVLKYTEQDPNSEVVYLSAGYEIRNAQAIKFVFAGPVRTARVEGTVPIPSHVTRYEVLHPGMNLVSVPVVIANTQIEVALASIAGAYSAVYRPSGNNYLYYLPGQPGNTLSDVAAGAAYWIDASSTCTLTLDGDRYNPSGLPLTEGWNAIAFPGTALEDLPDLSAANLNIVSVWTFDNGFKRNLHFHAGVPTSLNNLPALAPDTAALVKCSAGGTLTLPAHPRRVYFYHADHLGSGNVVSDETGQVVEELSYYPFGLLRHRYSLTGNTYSSEYTFSGKERDADSGLFYFGARYYDPVLCVFASVDPVSMHRPEVGLQDTEHLNSYEYAGNNPLVLMDPDGNSWFSKHVSHAVSGIGNAFKREMVHALGPQWQQKLTVIAISVAVGYGAGFAIGAMLPTATTTVGAITVGAIAGGATSYVTTGVTSLITEGKWQNASWQNIAIGVVAGGVGGYAQHQAQVKAELSAEHRAATEWRTHSSAPAEQEARTMAHGVTNPNSTQILHSETPGVRDYHELQIFSKEEGFTVTSTTGGAHNIGSAHYLGKAVDVRTWDHTAAQVDSFMGAARNEGYLVGDERVRPTGQKVWSGPHLHLQLP